MAKYVGLGAWAVLLASGCAHLVESRTIDRFTTALGEGDFDALKDRTSEGFEQKALRHAESLDDLKILKLPTGETSVTKVEDVSETEKRVTVQVGDSKRKLLYKLVQDEETSAWVVDDIYIRQRKQGLTVSRSVTEQMDLLLTVREFLETWDGGAREDVMAITTPELRRVLDELPPEHLARLTQRVVGNKPASSRFKPEAELDDNIAIVRLPRSTGKMILSMKLIDEQWKVDDVAVQSRREQDHIPSLVKMATALGTATSFLQAYAEKDLTRLKSSTTEKFFRGSLAPGDLTAVNLPYESVANSDYSVKLMGQRADFLIPGETETVKLSLVRTDEDGDANAPVQFAVEDVTLYEMDGSETKRLSAMFTSNAVMRIFAEAIANRDLKMLRSTATPEFTRRVWNHVDEQSIELLPLDEIPSGEPVVQSTVFDGAITTLTVMQGRRALAYVLRERDGVIRVDDIELSTPGRLKSFKQLAEVILPLRRFVTGLAYTKIDWLQRNSSRDFNRLVWLQTETVPDIGFELVDHLRVPLSAVTPLSPDQIMVEFGDGRFGSRVMLVREQSQWVVDDVQLIVGSAESERTAMKNAMRLQMAQGHAPAYTPRELQQQSTVSIQSVNRPPRAELRDDLSPAVAPVEQAFSADE